MAAGAGMGPILPGFRLLRQMRSALQEQEMLSFAGIISGIALGLPLSEAQQLATLVAGLSVCSPDTINKDIDRHSLNKFLHSSEMNFSDTILKLLED